MRPSLPPAGCTPELGQGIRSGSLGGMAAGVGPGPGWMPKLLWDLRHVGQGGGASEMRGSPKEECLPPRTQGQATCIRSRKMQGDRHRHRRDMTCPKLCDCKGQNLQTRNGQNAGWQGDEVGRRCGDLLILSGIAPSQLSVLYNQPNRRPVALFGS